jgi:hypothetical protein
MAQSTDLDLVRGEVRRVLADSAAWRELSPEQRKAFASHMVKVGHFLARDPGWLEAPTPAPATPQMAEALDAVDELKNRLAQKPGHIGEEFQAGAVRQGVEEFGNLVKTVDFPEFVSGLIQGVFQAIVDASIQQMEAYGELLAATAKSVDQFASDYVADDQAREHVAQRYPSILRIERTDAGTNRLAVREDVEDTSALNQLTGSTETIDFSDPEAEQKVVQAAKLEMARQRQKMMALMVMLGINRIVVTNGRINAKVVFDIEASDTAKRMASAGMTASTSTESGSAAAVPFPWGGGAAGYSKKRHRTTVRSSVDDQSESSAQLKAQLTGEVRVNFRSETLPPERMLDALQFEQINYMSQASGAAPPTATQPASGGTNP